MAVKNSDGRQREELKEKIVLAALGEFTARGIKDVKMDDIASMLSVSKRTIYEIFGDKEQLLYLVMTEYHRQLIDFGKKAIRESNNTLEVILALYHLIISMAEKVNRKFFIELQSYPLIVEQKEKLDGKNRRRFVAWIEHGVKEGLFREDADMELLYYVMQRDINFIVTTDEFPQYTPQELGQKLILFYLRGIATPRGRGIIEDYIRNNNK